MEQSKKINALYVHIPFCDHLCHYCDFTKMLNNQSLATRYLQVLFLELDYYAPSNLNSIYIGGGTPSALIDEQLETLLAKLAPLIKEDGEFSMEVNVENLTISKLELMARYGVNRLSIGVQTFNERMLRHMNRHHHNVDIKEAITNAKLLGFTNISIDLIVDLPNQTNKDIIDDIHQALALDVPHISTYSLTVHPHTVYGIRGIKQVSSDLSRKHYDLVLAMLREAGYERYEVSNFGRPGYYGKHNMTFWNNEYYYGIGLGASGYLPGEPLPYRYMNTMNMTKYLQGVRIYEKEDIDNALEEQYFLMLKLRLANGFSEAEYYQQFGNDFKNKYAQKIALLREGGLLYNNASQWYATDEGIMLLDHVILTLLS